MAAPDITGIADAAAAAINAADLTVDGVPVKTYGTEPRSPEIPAVWVRFDSFTRTGPDEAESQLGARDWRLVYEVVAAIDATEPARAQTNMRDLLGSVLDAVDQSADLSRADVLDARLVSGEQQWTTTQDRERPLLLMICNLDVWALSHY